MHGARKHACLPSPARRAPLRPIPLKAYPAYAYPTYACLPAQACAACPDGGTCAGKLTPPVAKRDWWGVDGSARRPHLGLSHLGLSHLRLTPPVAKRDWWGVDGSARRSHLAPLLSHLGRPLPLGRFPFQRPPAEGRCGSSATDSHLRLFHPTTIPT
jgi:hypothetical protein